MITWSSSSIPIIELAAFNCLVTSISALLGWQLPLGWLCMAIMAVALQRMASLKTSRGCMRLEVAVPEVISRCLIILFFRLRHKTQNFSTSRPREMGRKKSFTCFALLKATWESISESMVRLEISIMALS